jgi:hypothetical protein
MKKLISSKPYKQWCRARGIDFATHMAQFPSVAMQLTMPKTSDKPKVKLAPWEKIKNFFKY